MLRLAFKFLLYRLKSFRLHGVHSPFVFDLYEHVIKHTGHFQAYKQVEALRQQLLADDTTIEVTDFGAGSRLQKTQARKIKDIARISAKPKKYAQLLFRLVNYFQPEHILELGTSLGLTTAYLAAARKNKLVTTLEGCPNIIAAAQENFRSLELQNVKVIPGNIDYTLKNILVSLPKVDFIYFDGNHRYEATMRYFKECLKKRSEESVFILDDIYWSAEMERAWLEICRHPDVTISIDLFQIGILFFRKNQPKQHFTLWF